MEAKESTTSFFLDINELVFFSDSQSFHTLIYRGKQLLSNFFCQIIFVALVTENRLLSSTYYYYIVLDISQSKYFDEDLINSLMRKTVL